MSRIRVLDSDVVNKIAAGEVVERPASVVKELVENAIDAGATRIEVELRDGGRELIQVVDDGTGMSREEASLALERHATSKLRDADGLFSIASFGFRGEAVPAIASVSRLTLVTREPDALEGTRIEVEGGELKVCEPTGAPRGTAFTIRDLFFATPARRKFLKRADTETGHATEALIRLALARPDVGFTLRSGGRVGFQSPASTDVRERIAAALGKDVFPHLLPVEHEHGFYGVRGHIASPEWSAPTGRAIYTFVNGRFVRDRQLLHAVGRAYADVLPEGRFPCVVLFLELPPGQVDVNVHPQKIEVRFADPRAAYDAIYRAIGETLRSTKWLQPKGEQHAAPARTYEGPASPQPVLDWHARARAAALRGPSSDHAVREAAEALWPRKGDEEAAAGPGWFGGLRYIGELARSYLVCESPGGDLVVLDRHAAQERVAFQELRGAKARGELAGQPFLFPTPLELAVAEARILVEHVETLGGIGVEVEPFGGTTFALKAVPAALVGADYRKVLAELATQLGARPGDVEGLLAIVACHASARLEQALSAEEAQALLRRLDGVEAGARSLHCRAVVAELAFAELEKRAGRG